jgi:hypothetical protein
MSITYENGETVYRNPKAKLLKIQSLTVHGVKVIVDGKKVKKGKS